MDSITQILLGAAVGEAVLGKKIGNKAALWGAVAGTIPDLDVYMGFFFDDLTKNEMHRAFSHSLFFCLIFSPIFAWAIMRWERGFLSLFLALVIGVFLFNGPSILISLILLLILGVLIFLVYRFLSPTSLIANHQDMTKLMFWSLFTHPLLDAHTSWGTQLLWPLPWKYSWNNIFVADPLYTIPLLIGLIGVLSLSRASSRRGLWNTLGLLLSSAYMLLSMGLKFWAYKDFTDSLEEKGIEEYELSTRPAPLNTILWAANADIGDRYLMANYSLLDKSPVNWIEVPRNKELIAHLIQEDKVQRLIRLCKGEYAIRQESEQVFIFNDLRFGMLGEPVEGGEFVFAYRLSIGPEGLEVHEIEPPRPKGEEALKLLQGL